MCAYRSLAICLLLSLMIGCATRPQSKSGREIPEVWQFDFDGRQWVLGHQSGDRRAGLREYVLSGETVKGWSELVASFYGRAPKPADSVAPRALYEQIKRSSSRICPSAVYHIVEESENDILFEFHHQGCQQEPPTHYLMRIFSDDKLLAQLSYAQKTKQLAPEMREKWIKLLKQARVLEGSQ